MTRAERRLTEVQQEIEILSGDLIDEAAVTDALTEFTRVWESLTTKEQIRMVAALIEKVGYDGESGRVTVAFRAAGIRKLCRSAQGEA